MNKLILMQTYSDTLQEIVTAFVDSGGVLLLLGGGIVWAGAWLADSGKKGKISTGRFAGRSERRQAKSIAHKQRKERRTAKVSLRAGNVDIPQAQQSWVMALKAITRDMTTLFLLR